MRYTELIWNNKHITSASEVVAGYQTYRACVRHLTAQIINMSLWSVLAPTDYITISSRLPANNSYSMNNRQLALTAGGSYVVIFITAIFANFVMLEGLLADPVGVVNTHAFSVRLGVMAFLVSAVFDVVVAWALYEMYRQHVLTSLSTFFRVVHAVIMGLAVYALLETLRLTTAEEILGQATIFNNLWLIGLFFFGAHLILLARIVKHIRIIPYIMALAGGMYMVDTSAHFLMANYDAYADIFLAMVAIPSIFGEMAFAVWLLWKGGKDSLRM